MSSAAHAPQHEETMAPAEDAGSPGAFLTEVDETKQPSPLATPRKHADAAAGSESTDALRAVIRELRHELSASRQEFANHVVGLRVNHEEAYHFAALCHEAAMKKDVQVLELEEELERRKVSQKELNYRGHFALLATADRAGAVNRVLRHAVNMRDVSFQTLQRENSALQETLERERAAAATHAMLSKRRIDALEEAHAAAQKLIEELRKEISEFAPRDAASSASASQPHTPVASSPVANEADASAVESAAITTLRDANQTLAKRIMEVRTEHASMADRLDSEMLRADAAMQAQRAAEDAVIMLRAALAEAAGQIAMLTAQQHQAPAPSTTVPKSVSPADLERLESLGGATALLATLSERTQLLAEMDDENRRLREEIVLLEARCVTTETRLHHSVEEGVATSILLERGIGRLRHQPESDTAETRRTLTQAAMTLRRALEREGYEVTTLPLAPDASLDLPYLRQILNDHADLCAKHFHKGGAGHVVPSATRQPLVYRS